MRSLPSTAVLGRYGISISTLYRLRVSGKLLAVNVNGRWYYDAASCESYFAGQRDADDPRGRSIGELVQIANRTTQRESAQ